MASEATARLEFGPFSLSPAARLLARDGEPVEIGGRSFDLLAALLEQPGRVISKGELLKRVWSDVVVEDGSLRFHMAGLRRILGDGENGARYIATQVGVGYAFVAPVRRLLEPVEAPPASREPAPEQSPPPCNLPGRLARIIGRESDIAVLRPGFDRARLFTIVGPAGVGKTTLAVELAHQLAPRFEGHVAFVDLAMLDNPRLVPSSIAEGLRISVQTEDAMSVVLGHMRARPALLVLDNCEHLIEAVSSLVERVCEAAPDACLLATSREPLRVREEHVHWLGALDCPDDPEAHSLEDLLAFPAVTLFVERATAANSALELDLASVRLMAEMCNRLDGLALPIELTAVRAAAHGLKATSALLGERFSLAWSGRRTSLPRQQTLKATLDWSYQLLSDVERLVLERLTTFHGPFSTRAALRVAADGDIGPDEAAAALEQLTAKSLLSPDRWGEPGFYRLLEITRAYAREKFAGRGREENDATSRRMAVLFQEELEKFWASDGTYLGRQPRFSLHLSSIRSALEWCFGEGGDRAVGVRLASASARAFLTLSLMVECRTWCASAIAELDEDRGTSVEVELQAALGLSLMFTRGNGEAAGIALLRALEVATQLGDRWSQLRMLGRLHIFHERIGDYAMAREHARTAVEVAGDIGEPEAIAIASSLAGISSHLAGEQTRAREELELALRRSLPSTNFRTINYGFDHRNRSAIALARTLWLLGEADEAKRLAEATVAAAAQLDHPVSHCIAMLWTLSVLTWRGEVAEAAELLDSFDEIAERNALGPYIAAKGGLHAELNLPEQTSGEDLAALEESLARLKALRYELLTTQFELALALELSAAERSGEALALIDVAISRCEATAERYAMAELLRAKAAIVQRVDVNAGRSAQSLLTEAMACASEQGALAWELRAAIDLARFQRDAGRSEEARQLLTSVRARFAQGSSTRDLMAADLLLAALAIREEPAPRPREHAGR